MKGIQSICVFCGSREGNDPSIPEQAGLLGKHLAKRKITLVYGGSRLGIMGKVAAGAHDAGGKIVGVIPDFLKTKEVVHMGLSELVTTRNMHDRKMQMQERSDGFITLPGGFGTLEELFEIITWAQLGLHKKPIGLLNVNGYYDDLLNLLDNMVQRGFLNRENLDLLLVETDIERLLHQMDDHLAKTGSADIAGQLKADQT